MDQWGKSLHEGTIKKGLRELNSEIHFDMGTALNQWHPMQSTRQGVFYKGHHICSMDREMVPEYKVWTVDENVVPCSLGEADQENVSVTYKVLDENTEGYDDLYALARMRKDDSLQIRRDGELVRLSAYRKTKTRGRCIRVGWRHTFEAMLQRDIPGVTRTSLATKFGVDMLRYPVGDAPDVVAALMEE
jgi:hypothetical protein